MVSMRTGERAKAAWRVRIGALRLKTLGCKGKRSERCPYLIERVLRDGLGAIRSVPKHAEDITRVLGKPFTPFAHGGDQRLELIFQPVLEHHIPKPSRPVRCLQALHFCTVVVEYVQIGKDHVAFNGPWIGGAQM